MPWRAVCNPAVHVARYGFPGTFLGNYSQILSNGATVTADLVQYMNYSMSEGNMFLIDDPDWSIDFAPNGRSCLF